MAELSESVTSLPDVLEHFQLVQRPWGEVLLHKTLPIWIVEYAAFPNLKPAPQPQHWQVYYADADAGREPWSKNNWRLNKKPWAYRQPELAVEAAMLFVKDFK